MTWKQRFCPYFWKYQHFKEKDIFLRSFGKKSLFAIISENIYISRKTKFFWHPFQIIVLPKYPKISTFEEKVFFTSFWKKFFLPICMSKNISITRKRTLFWELFETTVIWPYNRKYQHFAKTNVFLGP